MNNNSDHEIKGGNTFVCNKTNGNSMPARGHLPKYCPYCREALQFHKYLDETDWIENKIDEADALLNGNEIKIITRQRGGYVFDVRYLEGPNRGKLDTVFPRELEELE